MRISQPKERMLRDAPRCKPSSKERMNQAANALS
jgi:hypothetical protein